MSLLEKIRIAQRIAGANAVIEELERQGLVPPQPKQRQALMVQADSEARVAEAFLSSGELKHYDPEREAFEAWLNSGRHAGNVSPWVEPGRYEKETHQLAWLAWQAARPKRSAIGRLINLAADCAQRKPLHSLDSLTDATHIGHRQFGLAYEKADDALAFLSRDLQAAIDAL